MLTHTYMQSIGKQVFKAVIRFEKKKNISQIRKLKNLQGNN